jgi:hypothetical protein
MLIKSCRRCERRRWRAEVTAVASMEEVVAPLFASGRVPGIIVRAEAAGRRAHLSHGAANACNIGNVVVT